MSAHDADATKIVRKMYTSFGHAIGTADLGKITSTAVEQPIIQLEIK